MMDLTRDADECISNIIGTEGLDLRDAYLDRMDGFSVARIESLRSAPYDSISTILLRDMQHT